MNSTISSITEPPRLYFYDVHEKFFDAYRAVMNPFFKDAEGKISKYTEMKKNALYVEPIYTPEDRNLICDEARKFVMSSDNEWSKVQNNLQRMGRTPVQVQIIFQIKMYKILCKTNI